MNLETPLTIRSMIEPVIKRNGGWVNTHAHADRSFTLSPDVLHMRKTCTLQQKWDALDKLKSESTEEDFYRRFCQFFELMISQGVTAVGTFVDIDPQSRDRAIKAGVRAREHYADQLTVKFANQTLKGVIDPEARQWFDIGSEMVDIIGALPKRDEKDYGKGSEAIHGISIAAHSRMYRRRLYDLMKKADVMMIACPTAWIDTPRSESIGPVHNSMTPVDELDPAGITVALGTDNVCDAMVPWNGGDMWHELMTLATGCRYDEMEALAKIATVNGRRVLGLPPLENTDFSIQI